MTTEAPPEKLSLNWSGRDETWYALIPPGEVGPIYIRETPLTKAAGEMLVEARRLIDMMSSVHFDSGVIADVQNWLDVYDRAKGEQQEHSNDR